MATQFYEEANESRIQTTQFYKETSDNYERSKEFYSEETGRTTEKSKLYEDPNAVTDALAKLTKNTPLTEVDGLTFDVYDSNGEMVITRSKRIRLRNMKLNSYGRIDFSQGNLDGELDLISDEIFNNTSENRILIAKIVVRYHGQMIRAFDFRLNPRVQPILFVRYDNRAVTLHFK